MATISWTRPMLERLKKAHAEAVTAGQESFTFDGHQFITAFAGFLIEYLEPRLPR